MGKTSTRILGDRGAFRDCIRGFETLKKSYYAEPKNGHFDRKCIIVSFIDLCKKAIFENFVTYEGLHGHRRHVDQPHRQRSTLHHLLPEISFAHVVVLFLI